MLCVVPPTAAESDASSTLPILYYIILYYIQCSPLSAQRMPGAIRDSRRCCINII